MITVGFFIQNSNLGGVDCSRLTSGNPGIGGTEYEFLLVASELARRWKNEFRVIVFTPSDPFSLEQLGVDIRYVDDSKYSLLDAAANEGCDIVVIDSKMPASWFSQENSACRMKFVAWAHLDSDWRKYREIANNTAIARLVCVGREQLDLLRDHDVFRKATYIYNCYPFDESEIRLIEKSTKRRKGTVAFVGSLTPSKGFHILADAWPKVLNAFPEAELHIYGSGSLYRNATSLGPLGLAEAAYEQRFVKPLSNNNGVLFDSVHFHGLLHGRKLREKLAMAEVGVINPNTDETFGLSAIDLQLAGCKLVVRQSPGVMDTCGHSPFSYETRDSLPSKIIEALASNEKPSIDNVLWDISSRFGVATILPQWRQLFIDITTNAPVRHEKKLVHHFYRMKWLRELNRHARSIVPFLPPISRWQEIMPAIPKKVGAFISERKRTTA